MILASYIPKCSLSDPQFQECLIENANKVIPIIAKGDASYNIPPLSPIKFTEAPIDGSGIKYVLHDVSTDDWKKLVVTDALFDMKNEKASFVGIFDILEGIAQNYTIKEGKILDIPVYGHGKYNMTFGVKPQLHFFNVNESLQLSPDEGEKKLGFSPLKHVKKKKKLLGVKIKFSGDIRFYKNGEDEYIDYFNSRADMSCERVYFHFENLQSKEKSDVNAYIDENWEKFFAQTKSAFDRYCNAFINYQVKPIISAVPFNKIFLP